MAFNKKLCLGCTILVFLLTWVFPPWPVEQVAHAFQSIIAMIALGVYARTHPLSFMELATMCCLIIIHSLAARWLYAITPVNDIVKQLWEQSIQTILPFHRATYNRLVHFLFGVCMTPTVVRYFRTQYKLNNLQAMIPTAVAVIVIVGIMIYEWLEWLIALSTAPNMTEKYFKQQSSSWGIHKNMMLATLGYLCWLPYYLWLYTKERKSTVKGSLPPAGV